MANPIKKLHADHEDRLEALQKLPMHTEVTVWCGLWAGSITGP